jgi:hypothetical protein
MFAAASENHFMALKKVQIFCTLIGEDKGV